MFIGHYAVALAARRAVPAASLGLLVAAAQLSDLIWPILLLAGIEHVRVTPGITRMTPLDFTDYPVTHSLLGCAIWATASGAVVWLWRRDRTLALVTAAVVISHWVLDFVTHRPDLQLWPGSPTRVGLGLWNSPAATIALEAGMFAAGSALYLRGTRARDRAGRWAVGSLLAFLALVYVANLVGPPPPSEIAIAWSALLLWPVVAWAEWGDRHREPVR
jgi:membrane-bound metal-dependent hydrolase YbcI (DUF457 family)